ncbi:MAG: hypothetical protein EOO87_03535 [Pedobacter sp.]|nr:MAG: hypothetical protein EOO87_03535 [Pedobacter sp.]
MITDSQTNFIYLADALRLNYPVFSLQLERVLGNADLHFDFLPLTKDVWAVDYMPIQLKSNEFLQFKYQPDYLLNTVKWRKTISDTDLICESIGLKTKKTEVVLDGGNVVKCEDKVILCDKIFLENPKIGFKKLIIELENMFQSEVIIIPTHPLDKIGHADGILRFYDRNTVLINDFSKEDRKIEITYKSALKNAGLDFVEIPYNPYKNSKNIDATGIYMNYLHVGNIIVLPVFGLEEDEKVVKQFEQLFPLYQILTVESSELAQNGGILNCITWNILKAI